MIADEIRNLAEGENVPGRSIHKNVSEAARDPDRRPGQRLNQRQAQHMTPVDPPTLQTL
jgi:hypothetical protein